MSTSTNSTGTDVSVARADTVGAGAAAQPAQQLDPEVARKLAQLRSAVRENFGKAVMAMMMLPRYRSQMLADLQHLVLDPMLRDRLAIAYPPKSDQAPEPDMAGFAIWASVSEEVDARIREQVKAGVFPIRLKSEEWTSGPINWLLDVVATDKATTAAVIASFRQVAKSGELRLHPLITRLVEPEILEKMGARKTEAPAEPG
ncbi:toxin-activating lysine-acyltransferase [Falsiroseomonas oryzae]|uniref:toxin-activating lysine-acyltransferase n=1 Tax=Falsiroseomonas oryzae TaxID=2766473 RepID=UPI0022EAF589|nr:toxin-activating lysine-acyltransferase [Roseomonas sp. MO-31]